MDSQLSLLLKAPRRKRQREPGWEDEDGDITALDGVGVGVGLERRGGVTVRILEPLRGLVGEGVGHRGRAESWASSGKGEKTVLSISGQCGTVLQV